VVRLQALSNVPCKMDERSHHVLSPNNTREEIKHWSNRHICSHLCCSECGPWWCVCGKQRQKPNQNNAVFENCALLGYYTASNGNFLPTFRDNVSVPSLGAKKTFLERNGCLETSVRNYNSALRNIPGGNRPHLHSGGSLKGRNCFTSRNLLRRADNKNIFSVGLSKRVDAKPSHY